jgi:hypothetical protein
LRCRRLFFFAAPTQAQLSDEGPKLKNACHSERSEEPPLLLLLLPLLLPLSVLLPT